MANKNTTNGCLWIFVVSIFTIISLGFIKYFLGFPEFFAIIAAIASAIVAGNYLLGKPSIKSLVLNLTLIIGLFYGIAYISNYLLTFVTTNKTAVFNEDDIVSSQYIIENNDSIPVFTSNHHWRDNYGNNYSGALTVREKDYNELRNYMLNYRPSSTHNFWGGLYNYMEQKDAPSLDLVMQVFKDIHKTKNLNEMEFAEMVVSCIQDIPYAFVFENECLPAINYEPSIAEILKDCPECCIGNVAYGVQNPVSFIKNLKGDCDTRTVLIYTILKHFNYDVAIANSDFYRHSILGLNIPASGKQKMHRGKVYTLWETTAKYFKIGDLPNNTNDITHWNIVLTSK